MEISNNINRYGSTIQNNQELSSPQIQAANSVKRFTEAYKLDISDRAKMSSEYNDPDNTYPTFNSNILQYNGNLSLTYKS